MADRLQLFMCLSCQFTFVAEAGPKECVRCGHLYLKAYDEEAVRSLISDGNGPSELPDKKQYRV